MRELLATLAQWHSSGTRVALARLVGAEGSSPRESGAAMAVSEEGEVVGSVSGGCVEGAVVEAALEVIETGGRRLVSFGYSDEEGFAVGLTCGGTVHLFVEPFDSRVFAELTDEISSGRAIALATVIEGPGTGAKLLVGPGREATGTLGDPDLDRVVARDALGGLDQAVTTIRHYGEHGEAREETVSVFIECFTPPPRLLIFGAVDFTAALASAGKLLGFHVTVCDAREVFATSARFPMADEVVVDWPHRLLERTSPPLGPADAVCILTHEAKFDVPAILSALRTDVGYLGAMGSRRTHDDRVERLRQEGVTEEAIGRVMAPIGLDIGARTPEETAIAVLAEIITLRTGRLAGSLRDGEGPIHP